jgi:uncharacterized protein DUF397
MSYDTGWFKSSRSAAASNTCIEVRITDQAVAVRDSKAPEAGQLVFPYTAWRVFLRRLR